MRCRTNQVKLVITSYLGKAGRNYDGEFLDAGKALYLNFNPNKSSELSSLSFTLKANTGFSQQATVLKQENGYKADGIGGLFDILFTYSPSTQAFANGESQTYLITTSSGTLSASDFDFRSTPTDPGTGGLVAAIHVMNTGPNHNGSGWVTAPEPSSLTLLGLTGFGLVGFGWHRRKRTPVNPCG